MSEDKDNDTKNDTNKMLIMKKQVNIIIKNFVIFNI